MSAAPAPEGPGRVALGVLVFAAVACVSYAGQRLAALGNDPALIFAQAHIPYFGRVALAAIHGAMAGLVAAVLVRDAAGAVRAAAWWVPVLVVPAAIAMGVYP